MRNAGKIAVLCASVFLLLGASACKKKFDPNDFDGGAAAAASGSAAAAASAPPVDSSAATADNADAGDGLAPLQEGKTHVAGATGAGGGGGGKPKDPPECAQARDWCNQLPPAQRHTKQGEKNCNDFRFACFNKGGHL
jgi:hypothetical protein